MASTTRALYAGVSALLALTLTGAREAAAAIPAVERDALVQLYTSTGGASWTNQTNWLGAAGTECTWYGVSCDAGLTTVQSIDLGGNALTGVIPSSLGNLTSLQGLYLYSNQLTGPIPSTLGNLTNLQGLDLYSNRLTGTVPPTLGNLTNLHELYLSSNRLTGAIPLGLGNLTKLQDLELSGNELTGAIPPSLGNLTNVSVLYLGQNQLTGPIPSSLGNLTNLNSLDLGRNGLTGAILPSLGNLTNLWYLGLGSNKLTGPIPLSLGNLTNLNSLDLGSNKLTGPIPATLGNLTTLHWLFLSSNQLTGAIPPALGNLTNLQGLYLDGNKLTGPIPSTLGNLTHLHAFELSANKLTGPIPSILGNLPNLKHLGLGSNQLTGPILLSLGNLTNLQYLDLDSNRLTGPIPPSLGNLTGLYYLYLGSNQLTGSIPASLGNLTNLESLHLGSNQLTGSIPAAIGGLTNLWDLTLGQNRLTGAIPRELGALSRLIGLSLESNALRGSIPVSFTNLTSLKSLDVRWNLLSTADPTLTAFMAAHQPGWQNTQTVPPTNLMVFPATATSVTLTWTPLWFTESRGGYQVLLASSPGGPYSLFGTTSPKSGISTTVTGLVPGSTHYFALAAVSDVHANNQNVLVSDPSVEGLGTTYPLEPVQFSAGTYKVSEAVLMATITVKRSGALTDSATVSYEMSAGMASSGVDYQPRAGTLTFKPHVAMRSFTVPIINDTLDEPDETVILRLQNPVNCVLGPQGTAVLTITDNDAGGVVQYGAASYAVGESAGSATITLRRTGGAAGNVSVSYAATAGTATASVDFVPVSGTLTFGVGKTTASFSVPIIGDGAAEGAETVHLSLSAPSGGATVGPKGTAVLTIVDDESTVELGAPSYGVMEGVPVAVAVKRTGDLSGTATVHYVTINGTAIAGTDYTAASGTLTFGPGMASRIVSVRTTNDTLNEPSRPPRTFAVAVDTPTGGVALGQRASATVTIKDNDPAGVVEFSVESYKVAEKGGSATIAVTRTGGTASGVTVHYATANGSATAGVDYVDTSGTLTFSAGQTRVTFKVPVLDDAAPEGTETVIVGLDAVGGGATLGPRSHAHLWIADDEMPAFRFSAETYRVVEGAPKATITVRREGDLTQSAQVYYSTLGGTADADQDYESVAGWLTFAARATTQTFAVPILNDALDEPDEMLELRLLYVSPGNDLGWPRDAILTIVDNDKAGTVQFVSPAFSVVDRGTPQQALITVARTGGTSSGATVYYATSDGTATAGSDYVASRGLLAFATSQVRAAFPVQINGDAVVEGNETVNLKLSSPRGGANLGAQSTATLWIADPTAAAKLVFVHGASGRDWLSDDLGGLASALRDNNYFVSDTSEDWGPPYVDGTSLIGAHTDIGEWWEWFRGSSSATHLNALYREQGQRSDYARLEDPDPARENEIVLLQSSFANSRLLGLPTDPPAPGANPLRGQPSWSGEMTVANAKGIYNDLLEYFKVHPEKLFVVVTAPPLAGDETTPEEAANARALNEWLVNDWLRGYGQKNVAVLDFFGTLTSNGGSAKENDLGAEAGGHHRWWNGAVQHVLADSDVSAYAESVTGSQPTAAGMEKATVELVTLLNFYRNRWKGLATAGAQAGVQAFEGGQGPRAGVEAIAPPGRRGRRP